MTRDEREIDFLNLQVGAVFRLGLNRLKVVEEKAGGGGEIILVKNVIYLKVDLKFLVMNLSLTLSFQSVVAVVEKIKKMCILR